MQAPENHALRLELASEVHARPHEALRAPLRASYLAVLGDAVDRERELAHVAALCSDADVPPPRADAIHFSADLGRFRLRWERHTEFSSYTFLRLGAALDRFGDPAAAAVPAQWLQAIPGRTLVAAHAELLERGAPMPSASEISAAFGGNYVVGADIGDAAAAVFTDFRVHGDGFGRFLLIDRALSRYQAGRTLQRLFEIETYRMMALLALPIARQVSPRLDAMERQLAALAAEIATGAGGDEAVLEQLTRLAADVENVIGASRYRFSAMRAYDAIVAARIAELRERRLAGTQTIGEFMARRLAPAIATCESASRRLIELSERVARANELLATRVGVVRERQSQELLASMNRRARLQLRLQETVEGLSVAAITYYVVGLVGYAAKALKASGRHGVDPDVAVGIAIPIVALLAALGLRYVRRSIARGDARAR